MRDQRLQTSGLSGHGGHGRHRRCLLSISAEASLLLLGIVLAKLALGCEACALGLESRWEAGLLGLHGRRHAEARLLGLHAWGVRLSHARGLGLEDGARGRIGER